MRVAKTEATRSEQVHRKCRVARRGGRMRAMGYALAYSATRGFVNQYASSWLVTTVASTGALAPLLAALVAAVWLPASSAVQESGAVAVSRQVSWLAVEGVAAVGVMMVGKAAGRCHSRSPPSTASHSQPCISACRPGAMSSGASGDRSSTYWHASQSGPSSEPATVLPCIRTVAGALFRPGPPALAAAACSTSGMPSSCRGWEGARPSSTAQHARSRRTDICDCAALTASKRSSSSSACTTSTGCARAMPSATKAIAPQYSSLANPAATPLLPLLLLLPSFLSPCKEGM
mmetsp:Transcript_20212/g.56319  ORF Transcript_20212/g.56319 Transcript_20212/m.56319 type:complete len:290 (+) Transcript_20212:310-1179(+)